MKKTITTITLTFICLASLLLVFSVPVNADAGGLRVVSYSWYTSENTGNFIVVGEVQNNGTSILSVAKIFGMAYTNDGEMQCDAPMSLIMAEELLPGQTAPFYMQFTAEASTWGNLTWVTNFNHVSFRFFTLKSNSTTSSEYQDLRIVSPYGFKDAAGNYNVSGVVFNNGTGYPEKVWVVGAFYDSTGKVIAVGLSDYLRPYVLSPNEGKPFMTSITDQTDAMADNIASFNLTVLSTGSMTEPTPSPSTSSSPTQTPSTSGSPNPTASDEPTASVSPSDQNQDSGLSMKYVYAIVAAVVIAVVVIALALIVRRRRTNA